MKNIVTIALGLVLLTLVASFDAGAVDGPHIDPVKVVNTSCTNCHYSSLPSDSVTFNSNCLSCHSDFTTGRSRAALKTSHNWIGTVANPAAGAQSPATGALSQVQDYTGSQLACVSCHNPHTNRNTKYLRIANNTDQLCLDCHRSRNVQTSAAGSHPVLVGYSSAAKAAPSNFVGTSPVNANPANPSSNLGDKLSNDGKLLCSTCHGVHTADSRSSNYVNGFKNISTGDGYLLRTNPRGAKVASGATDTINICTNCHAGKLNHNAVGQDIQCIDCHGAHVGYDADDPSGSKGTNVKLIRRDVTKSGQPSKIFFRSTEEYINTDGAGPGVCEGCHTAPTTGTHAGVQPTDCKTCHTHTGAKGSFSPSCGACHGYPPAAPHPNNSNCSTCHNTAPSVHNNGTVDVSTDCNACHGNPPAYANGSTKANSHGSAGHMVGCNTCHVGTTSTGTTITNTTLHMNSAYNLQAGAGASFSYTYASTGGTCSNISCHGNSNATWGKSIDHTATPGSGDILMFTSDSTHDITPLSIQEECTLCHYADLVIQHGNNCAVCHSGANPPRNSISGAWNKTCQQGSCHPAIHTNMQPDHFGKYWNSSASCELCHDTGGYNFPGPGDNCSRCHSPRAINPAVPPPTPTGIVTFGGNALAVIDWTTGAGTKSSLIRYGTVSGTYTATIDPAASPTTITGLSNGTPVYLQIGAKNTNGTTWSAEYSVTPLQPLPSAPYNISAAAGNGQATISWAAGSGSTSSLIRYGTSSGNLSATIDPATSPRTITGLTNGAAIYYQVGAKNSVGIKWNANIFTVTPVGPPSAPTGISAAAGAGQATISWTAGIGSTSSLIRYGTASGNLSTIINPATSPRTITGLTNGVMIYYQVGASNSAGTTWNTAINNVTPVGPPSAPSGISAAAGDGQATISWSAGTGSTSSLIRYGTTSGNLSTSINPATSPRTITGLTNGVMIYYQVGASNGAGTTWNSTIYSVTPVQSLPSAPTGVSAAEVNTQVTITWTAGTGSTSSLIRYGTTSGNLATTIDPAASPRMITGLTSGITIYYQVGAKNAAGTSWSIESSITPVVAQSVTMTFPIDHHVAMVADGRVWVNSQQTIDSTMFVGPFVEPSPDGPDYDYWSVDRSFISFNTSSLGSGVTITSAKLYLDYQNSDYVAENTVTNVHESTWNLTSPDYNNVGNYINSYTFATSEVLGLKSIIIVPNYINRSGSTKFALKGNDETLNNADPGYSKVGSYLEITYTSASPAAPSAILSTAGNGQATISWTAGTGSTSSLIRYGTTTGNYTTTIDPATSPRVISSLTNGIPVYYQVGAKNTVGTTWSSEYNVTPAVSLSGTQTWTTSGTFTVPAGVTSISINALGGGGHGGSGSNGDGSGTFDGANGGNAVVIYQSVVKATAGGGLGGKSTTTDWGAAGGAGGVATGSLTGQTLSNGGAGSYGTDADDVDAGSGGGGGSPNGFAGSDGDHEYDAGGGGGGGGGRVQGTLAVIPGSTVSISIGTDSSVTISW